MAIDFNKIQESPHLLDVLVQMEDVLDSFDLYVFKNWIDGEVVEGPKVRRYWFDFTLRYPIDKMPDPKGAMRLLKHGLRINYEKATLENEDGSEPVEEGSAEDAPSRATHWEIKISIPRRLLSDMNAAELDFYDEEVEVEDVQDAQDTGMNDETGYTDDAAGEDPMDSEEEEPDAPF
jgi:hypothetical protein